MSGRAMRPEKLTVQVETQRKERKEADQHPSESSVSAFAEQLFHVSPPEGAEWVWHYATPILQVLIRLAV